MNTPCDRSHQTILALVLMSGCVGSDPVVIAQDLPGGLLSVSAPAVDDVWIVGASAEPADGTGPTVLHYDGTVWEALDTSAWAGSELWWIYTGTDELVMVGNDGLILEGARDGTGLSRVEGPTEDITFFGVWGASDDDLWAVGETQGGDGPPALWRRRGGTWVAWDDPGDGNGADKQTWFKVDGTAADDAWIVGTGGTSLRFDGTKWTRVSTGLDTGSGGPLLLTVEAQGERPFAVGGSGNGVLLEYDGSSWVDRSPPFVPSLNGVCANADTAWAVGQNGARVQRVGGTWTSDADLGLKLLTVLDWHGCALDPEGNLWTVGGRIASRPLKQGVVGYQGSGGPPAYTP